ncbi:hypothetical protein ATERTT37_002563 [Aspergillus terreus]
MAQAFSSALDSVFALDSEVDHLSQTIDQKRFQMLMKNRELEELQAKIRAAEERLKAQQANTPSGSGSRVQTEGGYQSTSSTTSPTDSAGQYSSGDELREQAQQQRT